MGARILLAGASFGCAYALIRHLLERAAVQEGHEASEHQPGSSRSRRIDDGVEQGGGPSVEDLRAELEAMKGKRDSERAGRIRAEAAVRKVLMSGAGAGKGQKEDASAEAQGECSGGISMKEIGCLDSCFRRRFGTPRQGAVVKGGRAILKIYESHNPKFSTQNLSEFSHVWLIYVFHENTNAGRLVKDNHSAVKSKVRPPRLDGRKVGLFSTRTPHRPNPIGLSLVKLDKVVNGTLHLSGIDLVHGTPILDVKPYIPSADSVPASEAVVPQWIVEAPVAPNESVTISADAEAALHDCLGALEFYSELSDVWGAIQEVLINDIRSKNMRDGGAVQAEPKLIFDNLAVTFQVLGREARVTSVQLAGKDAVAPQPEEEGGGAAGEAGHESAP